MKTVRLQFIFSLLSNNINYVLYYLCYASVLDFLKELSLQVSLDRESRSSSINRTNRSFRLARLSSWVISFFDDERNSFPLLTLLTFISRLSRKLVKFPFQSRPISFLSYVRVSITSVYHNNNINNNIYKNNHHQ